MPDKYSYKQNKKKKAARKPAVAQTPASGQGLSPREIPGSATVSVNTSARTATAISMTVETPRVENRIGARVSNLGAELRRVGILGGVIVVVLVVAALALT